MPSLWVVSSISSEELRSIAGRNAATISKPIATARRNCKISAIHLLHALQYSNIPLVGVSQRFPTLGSVKVYNGDGQDAGADKAKPPLRIAKREECTGYAGSKQDERDRKQDHLFKSAELLRSQHKARAVFQKKRPTSNAQRSIIQHPESRSNSGSILSTNSPRRVRPAADTSEESRVATGLFLLNVPRFHRV